MSAQDTNSGCTSWFLLIWLLGWSGITLTFDVIIARGITRQLLSLHYKRTVGTVEKSAVAIHHGEDVTLNVDIEYSYEVDGVGYENSLYRYGFQTSGDHDVRRVVARHPVESLVDVYYNPQDPQDSLLAPGISWLDLFILLFMLPFNLVMVGVFCYTLGARIGRSLRLSPIAVAVRRRDTTWFFKVYDVLPITAAGVTALAVSFVSIFVVGFGQVLISGWVLVISAWCCVLVASGAAYCYIKPEVTAEVNGYRQQIAVQLKQESDPVVAEFSKIESVTVREKTIVLKSDSDDIKIICRGERDAGWLRDWLHERLGDPQSELSTTFISRR